MTNSPEDIRSLLGLAFEIEGLLMLAERRDEMTPAEVYGMLQDKCTTLLDGVAALNNSKPAIEAEAEPEPDPVAPSAVEPEAHEEEENEAIAEAVSYEETEDAEPCSPESEPHPEPEPEPVAETVNESRPEPVAASAAPKAITLTLNDKFRFRRSLFGGSDARMSETLAILGSISDPDDLTDFITNDLCWNPEDQEVADFMAVVAASR